MNKELRKELRKLLRYKEVKKVADEAKIDSHTLSSWFTGNLDLAEDTVTRVINAIHVVIHERQRQIEASRKALKAMIGKVI
jgi:hypothetical protein